MVFENITSSKLLDCRIHTENLTPTKIDRFFIIARLLSILVNILSSVYTILHIPCTCAANPEWEFCWSLAWWSIFLSFQARRPEDWNDVCRMDSERCLLSHPITSPPPLRVFVVFAGYCTMRFTSCSLHFVAFSR